MTIKNKLLNSAKELTSIYSLSALGMLLALRIILGILANSSMALFANLAKISLNLLPIAAAGIMFGPVCAGLVGAAGDVLSFFINSAGQPYFPGFTLNGFLTGMIFGLILYKNNAKTIRIILACVINTIFIEIILSSIWLYFIYGAGNQQPYLLYLLTRVASEVIKAIPITILIISICKAAIRIPVKQPKKR